MGIHLYTYIDPPGIAPEAWAAAYDDSLRLLRAFPGGLMRLVRHHVAGHDVLAYSPEIEQIVDGRRSWKVEGDRRSLRCGESHELMRDLECYGRRGQAMRDILADSEGGVCASGAKTQGQPYHLPLLAVAMMLEDRFPRSAVAQGDLDETDAREAATYAQRVLGYRPALPIALDEHRLRKRLEQILPASEVTPALEEWLIPAHSAAIEEFARRVVERDIRESDGLDDGSLQDLASSGTPDSLTAAQCLAVEAVILLAARSRKRIPRRFGPPRISAFEGLASVVSESRLVLTIDTWEALAHEQDELQRLLTSLAAVLDGSFMCLQIGRALFENAALRHHAAEVARDDARLARIEDHVRRVCAAANAAD